MPDEAIIAVSQNERPSRLVRVATYTSVLIALILILAKFIAFIITNSVAILTSLVDSILDFLASIINLWAVRHALTPADSEHRFGHGKAEPLSGLAQSAFVAGSAVLLILEAVSRFSNREQISSGEIGIGVMVFSIIATLGLVLFQKYVVKRTESVAIMADSLHYTGDLLLNISVILALVLSTYVEVTWADPAFAIGIALFLLWNASRIARQSIEFLMDRELPDVQRSAIKRIVLEHPKVLGVHDLRTRSTGLQKFIQFHIVLDPSLQLAEAHSISDKVEMALMANYPGADIIIHQDPDGLEEKHSPVGSTLS